MVDEHMVADVRSRMDLDAGQPARDIRYKPRQPAKPAAPARMRKSVQCQGMQARVAGQHLPARTSRRVALEDAVDVFAQPREHGVFVSECAAIVRMPRSRSGALLAPGTVRP
jgi:hypothetical protein